MPLVSDIWIYFTKKRHADGSRTIYCNVELDEGRKCSYFHDQQQGNFNTTTLRKHLKSNHKKEFAEVSEGKTKPVSFTMNTTAGFLKFFEGRIGPWILRSVFRP